VTTRRQFIKAGAAFGAMALVPGQRALSAIPSAYASVSVPQTPLPGANIPKYVDAVPLFNTSRVTLSSFTTTMQEFQQRVLPASLYPSRFSEGTFVWGYKVDSRSPHWPGFTVEARRGTPTTVTYVNNLPSPRNSFLNDLVTIDQTIHWADPNNTGGSFKPFVGNVPTVVHLHGAEVPSGSDGAPEAWFTADGKHGRGYSTVSSTGANAAVYRYPNTQPSTTLWFHDHALGLVRTNIFSGLAAIYLVRDQFDTGRQGNPLNLQVDGQEIELLIQDRQFDTNGQLLFPDGSPADNPTGLNGPPGNPAIHPFWIPEFFGDVMVVNGKSWPFLNVQPRRYRFRIVNGCNARFLQMALVDAHSGAAGPAIFQIGTDGGLLDRPAKLNDPANPNSLQLFLAPAERADVIIDFAGLQGRSFTVTNSAVFPFPSGGAPDPNTDGQIMQFRVANSWPVNDTTYNPATGAPLRGGANQPPAIVRLANPSTGTIPAGVNPTVRRRLALVEVEGDGGPIEVLLNNSKWNGLRDGTSTPIPGSVRDQMNQGLWLTELPRVGATEVWELINLTEDAHPIHIHLIQFQILNRQDIDRDNYRALYDSEFPGGTFAGVTPNGTWGLVNYAPGVYIPGFGPPRSYNTAVGGFIGGNPDVAPFLQGTPSLPDSNEAGWKDTVKVFPLGLTRLVVRWAPTETAVNGVGPGQNKFAFDPRTGPGYVWHCHIIDHEDNEMMRPYSPTS
jgi:spore coat protein A